LAIWSWYWFTGLEIIFFLIVVTQNPKTASIITSQASVGSSVVGHPSNHESLISKNEITRVNLKNYVLQKKIGNHENIEFYMHYRNCLIQLR
jgi:hypothetical protein